MTTILSREWQTQDCAEIVQHLKRLLEHVEILDQQLVTTRDINAALTEVCTMASVVLQNTAHVYGAAMLEIDLETIEFTFHKLRAAIAKAKGEQCP